MQIKWGRVFESTGGGMGVLTHSSLGLGGLAPSVLREPCQSGGFIKTAALAWMEALGGPPSSGSTVSSPEHAS